MPRRRTASIWSPFPLRTSARSNAACRRIHVSAVLPSALARRMAISGDTPPRSLTRLSTVWRVTPEGFGGLADGRAPGLDAALADNAAGVWRGLHGCLSLQSSRNAVHDERSLAAKKAMLIEARPAGITSAYDSHAAPPAKSPGRRPFRPPTLGLLHLAQHFRSGCCAGCNIVARVVASDATSRSLMLHPMQHLPEAVASPATSEDERTREMTNEPAAGAVEPGESTNEPGPSRTNPSPANCLPGQAFWPATRFCRGPRLHHDPDCRTTPTRACVPGQNRL